MNAVKRIGLLSALATLACLVLCGLALHSAVQHVRDEAEVASQERLLRSLKSAVDASAGIGLSLEQMSSLQAFIERERTSERNVLSIDVFNTAGVLIHSTDRGSIGTPLAKPWVERLEAVASWQIDGNGERVSGIRFDNDAGQPLGGIAVRLRRVAPPAGIPAALQFVHEKALLLASLAACVALAGWGATAMLRRRLARYRPVALVLDGAPSAPSADDDAGDPLLVAARARAAAWNAQLAVLDDTLGRLHALDEGH